MEITDIVCVGLAVGLVCGFGVYAAEKGKVRGEEVVYTSLYQGREIEVVQQVLKWTHDRCFIRGVDFRLDEGELITDDGKLVGIGYTDTCHDCYCIRDHQLDNASEE